MTSPRVASTRQTSIGEGHPGETGSGFETDGLDNDENGKIDDVVGWDFFDDDNDPDDELTDPDVPDGHGTHTAGTVGAVVNNNIGVAGVAPNALLMPLRFLGPSGGDTADAVLALDYAVYNGARVANNSWGGGGRDPLMEQAIIDAGSAGLLFVAAAGNDGTNNDSIPHYPSNYELDNVLSVAALDPSWALADFSNRGFTSVDIAAPGGIGIGISTEG